jgi:DNA-binding NarL/FixJ family response regulator
MTLETLRVLVADDHPMYRRGLRAVLESSPAIELVGEATTGCEAVELVREHQPDLVLMDLHMPELSGIEATRRISALNPGTAVLVITMVKDDDSVFAAVRAGARGYVLKGVDEQELLRSIWAVANGEAVFGPGVAQRVLGFLTAAPVQTRDRAFPDLTEREREVVGLIAEGLNNHAIAHRLGLSPKTVMNYVSNVFTKLRVADRAEMIVRARQAGFGADSNDIGDGRL